MNQDGKDEDMVDEMSQEVDSIQRRGDAYRNERSVIFKVEWDGDRARMTSDDERVQRGDWRDIKLYR